MEMYYCDCSYFCKILSAFSSNLFYNTYMRLPTACDPVPPKICQNTKFWPFFKDCLGALDGTHIYSLPPAHEQSACQNRKGFISQNCLFGCSFNLIFVYALTGWEGSATDACIYEYARLGDLDIPEGKYYLADAGYPLCSELLVPYRDVQCHLAEWGCASVRYSTIFLFLLSICTYLLTCIQAHQQRRTVQSSTCISMQYNQVDSWCLEKALPDPPLGTRIQPQYPSSHPSGSMCNPQLYC